MRVQTEMFLSITQTYLEGFFKQNIKLPPPDSIVNDLLDAINNEIEVENENRTKGRKWKYIEDLPDFVVEYIVRTAYPIIKIIRHEDAREEIAELALYQETGVNEGIYDCNLENVKRIIQRYNQRFTGKQINDVVDRLKRNVKMTEINRDKNLIAVNNGVFDYETKQLHPFSPEYIFASKSRVDYNPAATNVYISNPDGTTWDVESWLNEFFEEPEMTNLLWEICGAVIRPHEKWDKAIMMYSTVGNNGKGTFCALLRNLCGKGNCASIKLNDFGKEFRLEPLLRASAIIVDENDVGGYVEKLSDVKSSITGDVISINRKFKEPIEFAFEGLMVQCINELPKVKDTSDSFYRRQICIPFEKSFTGCERKYIKHDYIKRKEVLEYVLYKVLNMNYHELSEPTLCKAALREYKQCNDPVREFWDEFEPRFKWQLLPNGFLYDLYKAWHNENYELDVLLSKAVFLRKLRTIVPGTGWYETPTPTPPYNYMSFSEPLIFEYNLRNWKNTVQTNNVNLICMPVLKSSYKGLLKK